MIILNSWLVALFAGTFVMKDFSVKLHVRVILKMKNPQIGLLTLLVVPMGTLRYHTKNGAHSFYPRAAIGRPIFTSMAM